MARSRLYHTQEEKAAARRINSQKYYQKYIRIMYSHLQSLLTIHGGPGTMSSYALARVKDTRKRFSLPQKDNQRCPPIHHTPLRVTQIQGTPTFDKQTPY